MVKSGYKKCATKVKVNEMRNELMKAIRIFQKYHNLQPPVEFGVPIYQQPYPLSDRHIPIKLENMADAPLERTSGRKIGLAVAGIGLLVTLVAGGLYKAHKTMNSPAYRALIEEAAQMPGTHINKARYNR